MISKRGELTTTEILEIILAVAVVLALVVLLYRLISPSFDRVDETAKSYFDLFEEAVEDGGSFSMWQPEEKGREFYLVYFHDRTSFKIKRESGEVEFSSFGNNVNHVCVCYWDGEVAKCESCKNLDLPMVKDGEIGEPWVMTMGEEVEIKKMDGYYEVVVK